MRSEKLLAETRQRAQVAISRARVSKNPELRRDWEDIAKAWLDHLAVLEGRRAEHAQGKPPHTG
jgi:hypothetical protein